MYSNLNLPEKQLYGVMNKENKPKRKTRVPQWFFAVFFKHGVLYSFLLSIVIFAIYMIGSIPDPGFSDWLLFLLLWLLWYSSLLLCVFSIFAMGFRVHRLVYRPSLRNIFGLFIYFIAGLFGAALTILNSFIVAAARGNI